jgi:hypothetical protein
MKTLHRNQRIAEAVCWPEALLRMWCLGFEDFEIEVHRREVGRMGHLERSPDCTTQNECLEWFHLS